MEYNKPITKLEDIIYYYREIKSLENLTFARLDTGILNKKTAFEALKEKRKDIETKYAGLLNPEDKYIFDNIEDLGSFLAESGCFSQAHIENSLEHELEHSTEIVRQGYKTAGFDCWLCMDQNEVTYAISTRVQVGIDNLPSHDAYKNISHAPSEPSIIDLMS